MNRGKKSSGELFWVEVALKHTTIAGKSRIIAAIRDINSRKIALQNLATEQERLSVTLHSIGDAVITTGTRGSIELLNKVGEELTGWTIAEATGQPLDTVLRAEKLTKQLLTFSRGGQPAKEASALDQIIRDSAEFILTGSSVGSKYDIPENLWLVDSDSGQISQVIQNLVLNARHAMPEGGVLDISCSNILQGELPVALNLAPGNYVKISILDHGVGIAQNIVDKIFDPYFSTKQEGSGLGLAITHSIIIKHGGHISVESEVGTGSKFTIYWPQSSEKPGSFLDKKDFLNEKMSGRILVMDDQKELLVTYSRMLERLGFQVETAENGKEAISLFEEFQNSGNMGGRETAENILEMSPKTKNLVSSGYSNDEVLANFRDYGFVGSLAKPVLLKELAQVIHRVLE